jgi:hypothetical protein
MEEEQLAALRHWGEGLRLDARGEVRAAGKAIVLLCDEVDRLELELWHGKTHRDDAERPEATDAQPEELAFGPALRQRLFRSRR